MSPTRTKPKRGIKFTASWLSSLPEAKRVKIINELTPEELDFLTHDWPFWARAKQMLPKGMWKWWLIQAGRGWGKMSDVRDLVKIPGGWKKLADIKDNDFVYSPDGNPYRVIKAHPIQLVKEAIRFTFDTGETIVSDKEHLWYTVSKLEDKRIRRGKALSGSIKTAEYILQTIKYGNRETNHRIPIANPIQNQHRHLEIEPYVMGQWLGDGSSSCSALTTEDPETLDYIREAGYMVKLYKGTTNTYGISNHTEPTRNKKTGRYESNGSLQSILKKIKVFKNKHIPKDYQNASVDQRRYLLQGLMDSDGYCEKNGWCEYCSINKRLANDVFELVSGLGIKARIYTGRATLNGKDCGIKYRVFFKTNKPVFRLPRKLKRQEQATTKQLSRHQSRFIVKAEYVSNVKLRCLTVDSPDHLFLIKKSLIATHNTKCGAETVKEWVYQGYKRIALIGATLADVTQTMVTGETTGEGEGLQNIFRAEHRPIFHPSRRIIKFHTGAVGILYSSEEPERLRGPQHEKAWADELRAWKYPDDNWSNLNFGLRQGDNPQGIITTTPRRFKLLKEIAKDPLTHITRGSTKENEANLSPAFIKYIFDKYGGTELGRQELEAELLDDVKGALWNQRMIDEWRVRQGPDRYKLMGVFVDPSVSAGTADEAGIVVGGMGYDNHRYVLEDASIQGRPKEWASQAIKMYYKYEADAIVAEKNNGGQMVEDTILAIDPNVNVILVNASRSKRTRAEPISAQYEQGKWHHAGGFAELEDEMTTWVPKEGMPSPNRMDALVWGGYYFNDPSLTNDITATVL